MPDIVEENEGEASSVIDRRRRGQLAAMARALAANNAGAAAPIPGDGPNDNPNGDNNDDDNNVPAANNNNANNADATPVAREMARLAGVDVRNMFRRLGVQHVTDIRYIRERDLEGIPRITAIQKRKLWAIMKYIAADHVVTPQTSLSQVAKALNLHKRKERETSSSSTGTTITTTAASTLLASTTRPSSLCLLPLFHTSKLDEFDGDHSKWLVWKNKARYALAQTVLGTLIKEGEKGQQFAKKYQSQDNLLFHMLAEAIVNGSARHLIRKAEAKTSEAVVPPVAAAAVAAANDNHNSKLASGRDLWQLLVEEYSQGPMAYWILSDARQVLQKLTLISPTAKVDDNNYNDHDDDNHQFMTYSAHEYVKRFRSAKETLEEFKQALPDAFLASTFVEHIYDSRLERVKKQLLQDLSTQDVSLEACIRELLMADHITRARQSSHKRKSSNRVGIANGSGRKRSRPGEEDHDEADDNEQSKRARMDNESEDDIEEPRLDEPDEAKSY